MYTTYGFIPKRGTTDDFLKKPDFKERYSNDWPDEDGVEFDLLSTPKKKAREFDLVGYILADSASQFWTRYNALYDVFDTAGTQIIRVGEFSNDTEHAAGINVFLKAMPKPKRLTRLKNNSGVIAAEITLQLQEAQTIEEEE